MLSLKLRSRRDPQLLLRSSVFQFHASVSLNNFVQFAHEGQEPSRVGHLTIHAKGLAHIVAKESATTENPHRIILSSNTSTTTTTTTIRQQPESQSWHPDRTRRPTRSQEDVSYFFPPRPSAPLWRVRVVDLFAISKYNFYFPINIMLTFCSFRVRPSVSWPLYQSLSLCMSLIIPS